MNKSQVSSWLRMPRVASPLFRQEDVKVKEETLKFSANTSEIWDHVTGRDDGLEIYPTLARHINIEFY